MKTDKQNEQREEEGIPGFAGRQRGKLVLSIAEEYRLREAERVGLKKECQRRRLIVASGMLRSQGFVEGFF